MTDDNMPDLLRLDNQLCFALYSASNAIVRAYRPLLDKLDITYPQYLVLLVLWQQDEISLKQLGEQLFLDSGTLTPLLKRLESKGLIRRERNERDERLRVLKLTVEGNALKKLAADIPVQMRDQLRLSDTQLQLLKAHCELVQKQLHEQDDC
ncbi:MAG: MarR family transcriptional regulator [Tolumonas sp.]|jgi:DNA-binding MarR family transcriptional regulator|uniref:MarR family winged helix-turn-helix transcriptional regulator n=1 Tax=Tolumonas auensis TaxID=43948 RepID=UPI001B772838|nr:MarR family transcriptional regulator [Tolumonas auensis]MBP7981095.1 MarR family transcriptional regulator [Tolumonas sp.]